MSDVYIKNVPLTDRGDTYSFPPATVAIARTLDASISTSTEITLNAETSYIEVYAIAQDVYLKWGVDDVTAANSDEIILAGTKERFAIPKVAATNALFTAIKLIERVAGATVIVYEK